MAHSVCSGKLVGWWVYQRKVCVHASKSGNRKVSYRQKRVKKDEEQSGVIRQLVGRKGIFSQTKGRKQHLAAAWWGSPLMSASCLHHTDEVMISRPPRQRRFFSSAAAETKCVGACIMLSRSIDRPRVQQSRIVQCLIPATCRNNRKQRHRQTYWVEFWAELGSCLFGKLRLSSQSGIVVIL